MPDFQGLGQFIQYMNGNICALLKVRVVDTAAV